MPRQATFGAEELAEAGLAVIAREGWSGLTMRATATQLGVSAMALYRVVSDSDALEAMVADHVGRGLPVPDGPLTAALDTWARTTHDRLQSLPGAAAFLLASWTEIPSWLAIVEDFLARAEGEGLHGEEAVGTVNAIFAYTLARAQLRDYPSTARPRQLAPLVAQPERYPLIRSNLSEFAIAQREKAFVYGLEALLEGLDSRRRGRHQYRRT
ncbi:MAG TPA: TetR/AcrR family transcriptional regulator C-terminal domain-containing protein [Acidimicrobiales bacterium]|nr:TetR/AcrR family transcriptional regulator C-terminal domain-containing protein [Acidimicrobiales bacterium]